jgi:hypothetical protein
MTYYSRAGNRFFQVSSIPEYTELPPGTYALKYDPQTGFYYEVIDNFEMPEKVYGDLTRYRDRIVSTFLDRPAATGVMLAGEKGSGKTLLAKSLATHMREEFGFPTIVLNAPWSGDAFNTLVQEMEQPAIFIFDEFEKVYAEEAQQQQILTLLDGVFPTKKLFVITTNDKWRIDRHMRNRPGRIFYMLDYAGLDKEFIREYAMDNLLDQSKVDSVVLVAGLFSQFNFDMLKALVEEMNRYDESAQDAMRMLNAKPEFEGKSQYDVRLFADNGQHEVTGDWIVRKEWHGNPVTDTIMIEHYSPDVNAPDPDDMYDEMADDCDYESEAPSPVYKKSVASAAVVKPAETNCWVNLPNTNSQGLRKLQMENKIVYTSAMFTPADIAHIDENGTFSFKNDRGYCLMLTKKIKAEVSYWDSLNKGAF